jgi:hypothetical protein
LLSFVVELLCEYHPRMLNCLYPHELVNILDLYLT